MFNTRLDYSSLNKRIILNIQTLRPSNSNAPTVDKLDHFLPDNGHLQYLGHRRPLHRVLIEHRCDQSLQLRTVALRNGLHRVLHYLVDESQQVVRRERVLQRAQLEEHAAERPDVAFESVGVVLAHFRTHVVRGAHHGHGGAVRVLEDPRNAEVSKLDGVVAREKHVLGFEVSVEDPAAVHILESQAQLDEPVEDLGLGEVRPGLLPPLDVKGEVSDYKYIINDLPSQYSIMMTSMPFVM